MSRLADVWSDVRLAGRLLSRAPAFTMTVTAALAIGIGASTATFSVVHAVPSNARCCCSFSWRP